MSKIAIVYWSGTGNTEAMADLVAQGVRAKGSDADLINATDFGPERLDEYDAYAFGCPAMGDEELEDTEFLPMYDAVEPMRRFCRGRAPSSRCSKANGSLCSGHTIGMTANGWNCGSSAPKTRGSLWSIRLSRKTTPTMTRAPNACALGASSRNRPMRHAMNK